MLASPWAVGSWAIGTVVHCLGGGVHDRTIALRAAVVLVQKIQAELRLRSGAASIKSVSVRLRQLRAPVARRLLAISPDAPEAAGTGKNQPDALRARVARLQRFHGFRQNTPESLGTSIETGDYGSRVQMMCTHAQRRSWRAGPRGWVAGPRLDVQVFLRGEA